MNYDGLVVAAVVAELRETLAGGRIQAVRQHNSTDLTIEIRAPGRTRRLFISVSARFPRFYLTASSEAVPDRPPGFCMLLRKHLEGSHITDIEQVRMDRIVAFRIARSESDPVCLTLEIMGRHSNLILLDSGGKVLGAAKNIGAAVSRVRQILPGRDYLLPPGSDKADVRDIDEESFHKLWNSRQASQGLREWLIGTFGGFGPFLADEITARAAPLSEESVWRELSIIAATVQTKGYAPAFIADERGRDLMVYPMHSVRFPASQQHARTYINEALDAFFRSAVTRSRLEEEKTQLVTSIRRAAASRKQTLKSVQKTLAESENAVRYRQIGELILSNLHAIAKGAKSVQLTDLFDPQMPEVEIELDTKSTAQQNAERYFRRYHKARDSVRSAEARRERALADATVLDSAIVQAEAAETLDEVQELKRVLLQQNLLRAFEVRQRQASEFEGQRIRRVETPEGWEILYAETAQANDHLTQKIARPNDVWLHARAVTGAHVVVRKSGRAGEVPRGVLMQAATLAAKNSQAKNSSLVPVDHTLKRHVRKPRGSPPGFVTYSNEKTIDVALRS